MVRNKSASERNWMKIIRNISLRRFMCLYFCENHFPMSSIYVGHFKPQIQTSKGIVYILTEL
ncbi:hypothetical protein T12_11065, partial [Trichinella patagoniensis]